MKHFSRDIIFQHAKENGFALVGVTNTAPSEKNPAFKQWISTGRHASMAFLENEPGYSIRLQPEVLSPGARSIIFLTARYPKSLPDGSADPWRGMISSYAQGEDYHHVLRVKARNFVASITRELGAEYETRVAIDSAPVLEKPLAQRAGLGWQGRNTCLISPEIGSFFFIVSIFIHRDIEPTNPFESDHCGTCRKCMDACPTGCILPDRTIDAGKCISYLTIENKGVIPRELRPLMGNMVFGCDICQSVCPWNQKVEDSSIASEFLPRNDWTVSPLLEAVLKFQPGEFNSIYQYSSIKRAKRSGFLRNAVVALGNTQSNDAIPVLHDVLTSEQEPLVRLHAAWALGHIHTPRSQLILANVLKTEQHPEVLSEIAIALNS